ncbi:MAG: ABC transporter substrate-binding protein [Acidimicrobiaceae bacterium]|nr:ABC transporter substrate-binding protein [Acidimicrobiaceae bacterium]MYE96724.1 ABC transporter substrate-binding protein [Acidimicrobiaceae bacterium]MYI55374.1 ABC transporter substrate-binding protein [Acidimicrobiaceae bacterium]
MKTKPWVRALCALAVLGLIAAACGDDDTDDGVAGTSAAPAEEPAAPAEPEDPEPEPTAAPAEPEAPDPEPEPEPAEPEAPAEDPLDLASVCPSPIIIQTDWFPESEHGAMYQMVGEGWTLDTDNMITTGPLTAGGVDTGVDIEIRAGGPAIGFASGSAQMTLDPEITLAYVSMDEAVILGGDTPTLSVVAPLEKNPQIIQWDPETYPDVTGVADLGELGVTINVFAGGTFIDVFVNEGVLSADQIDPSYDGGPARFIAEGGAIAQQGFASESPYSYEEVYPEWSKPVAFELIHDAGLPIYSQTLAIRPAELDTLRPCLAKFVPIVQQAVLDFAADPRPTNAMIVQIVADIGSFWQYSPGLAQFSVDTQIELGLIGNGPDDTVGNMEIDRIQEVIDKIVNAGFDVHPSRTDPNNLVTNEFIDESIGF